MTRSSCLALRLGEILLLQTLVLTLTCVHHNIHIHAASSSTAQSQLHSSSFYIDGSSVNSTSAVDRRRILGLTASKLVMVAPVRHKTELVQPSSAFRISVPEGWTADDNIPDDHEHVNRSLPEYSLQISDQLDDGLPRTARGKIVDMGLFAGMFSSYYYVEMGVGTAPAVPTSLMIDTGSSLTWVQCKKDADVNDQVVGPVYNMSASPSFFSFGCPSPACSFMAPISQGCNEQGECKYDITYVTGQYARGILGYETFTFDGIEITNIPFGCMREGRELNDLAGRGVLGWGALVFSLPQRARTNVFFCLPIRMFDGEKRSKWEGVLGLGDLELPQSTSYTRLIPNTNGIPGVAMEGISVDGERLPLSSSDFPQQGTLVDTGTFLSRLLPRAYAIVREAFRKAAQKRKLTPVNVDNIPHVPVDTCYKLDPRVRPTMKNTPAMAFYFAGGGTISLRAESILYRLLPDHDIYCLSFHKDPMPSAHDAVLGNQHLGSVLVSINTQTSTIGFTPKMC